jgi:hypothetical protein
MRSTDRRASGSSRRPPVGVHLLLERVLLCRYPDSSEVITLTLILPNLMEEHNVLRDVIAAIATIGVRPAVVLLSFSRRSAGASFGTLHE